MPLSDMKDLNSSFINDVPFSVKTLHGSSWLAEFLDRLIDDAIMWTLKVHLLA